MYYESNVSFFDFIIIEEDHEQKERTKESIWIIKRVRIKLKELIGLRNNELILTNEQKSFGIQLFWWDFQFLDEYQLDIRIRIFNFKYVCLIMNVMINIKSYQRLYQNKPISSKKIKNKNDQNQPYVWAIKFYG